MTDEEFWKLISLADLTLIDQEDCLGGVTPIIEALSQKPPEDICHFEDIMSQKLYALDYAVLYDELESSSDSFLYQRCYAVVSGHQFYANTFTADTRELGDFDWCQSLLSTAQSAWEKSQNSDWSFTSNISYETGSNEEGHKSGAKLSYQGKICEKVLNTVSDVQCDTIYQAIQNGNYDLAFAMIDNGEDLNIQNPLYAAVEVNNHELVARLIEKGADVDQPIVEGGGAYVTPLALAVMKNKISIVKFLLAAGATPTAKHGDEFCPLETACERGNMKMATLLLESGANPDNQMPGGASNLKQGSPLFSAVNSNKPAMVELVLRYGANPNIWDENRKITPFIAAAIFADNEEAIEIIKMLIVSGADINVRYGYKQNTLLQNRMTPSEYKFSEKKIAMRKQIVTLLIENGGKMNNGTVPTVTR